MPSAPESRVVAGPATLSELRAILHSVFGFEDFRPGQAEVLSKVLEGHPTLAVMPTGAGKSLCYQLPALALPGPAVVVSPLISLMEDQVQSLRRRGVRAAAWTHATPHEARRTLVDDLGGGRLDLVYVAPERFRNPYALERIEAARPSLFVVDEVHCVSHWGHDFRPDYARLGEVLARLESSSPLRFVGLTATATEAVRADIARTLGISERVHTIVTGFDRPNLELAVREVSGGRTLTRKVEALVEALHQWMGETGSAAVYAPTRKRAEEVAEALQSRGFAADAYHAGLEPAVRHEVQARFESQTRRVVVATNAFGMGIDKPDVRVVVHLALPDSPEAYYQEVGRAGRDGAPAGGVVLFDPADLRYAFMRLEAACPTPELVQALASALERHLPHEPPMDLESLAKRLEPQFGPATRAALVALEQAGDLRSAPDGMAWVPGPSRLDPRLIELRRQQARARLTSAIGYVTRAPCRRRYLVEYFDDPSPPERCGVCDLCVRPRPRQLEGDLETAALMALSCVARMRGRYGKTRVSEVLLGGRGRAVTEAGLDSLSTHGLLSSWRKNDVQLLLDSLVRAQLAAVSFDAFPRIAVTPEGAAVLRTKGPVHLDFAPAPARSKQRPPPEGDVPAQDRTLWEALRAWRFETAQEQGVPAYVVASNAVLREIVTARPESLEALESLRGMGPSKVSRYGEDLLRLVQKDQSSTSSLKAESKLSKS